MWAAVCEEEHCARTLKTAARKTTKLLGSVPLTFYKILENRKQTYLLQYLGKKNQKDTPLTGLEPAIFGSGGRWVIHYATVAGVDYAHKLKFTVASWVISSWIGNFAAFLQHTKKILDFSTIVYTAVKICKLLVLFKIALSLPVSLPFDFKTVKCWRANISSSVAWKNKTKHTPRTTPEPAIFGFWCWRHSVIEIYYFSNFFDRTQF